MRTYKRKTQSTKKNKKSLKMKGSSPLRKKQKTEESMDMERDSELYHLLMQNLNHNKIHTITNDDYEVNYFIFNKRNTENNQIVKRYLDILFENIAEYSGYNAHKKDPNAATSLCDYKDFLSVYFEDDGYKGLIEEKNSNIIIAVYNSLHHIYDTRVLGFLHFTTDDDYIFKGSNEDKKIDTTYYGVYIDLICSFTKLYKEENGSFLPETLDPIMKKFLANLPEGETIAKLLFKVTNNYLVENIQKHYRRYKLFEDKTVIGLDAITGTEELYKSLGMIYLNEENKDYKEEHWITKNKNKNEENFHEAANINSYFVVDGVMPVVRVANELI